MPRVAPSWLALPVVLSVALWGCDGAKPPGLVRGPTPTTPQVVSTTTTSPAPGTSTEPANKGLSYAPVVPWDDLSFEGRDVLYHVPDDPIAVVWAFHGTGGDTSFCLDMETVATLNALIDAGFGFVCTESAGQKWDREELDPEVNVDLAALLRLHEYMALITDLETNTPIYGLGFSDGGGMATVWIKAVRARGFEGRASAAVSSAAQAWDADEVPIGFVLPINDPQPTAQYEVNRRLAEGVPGTDLWVPPEFPVEPEWFARNPAVDDAEARVAAEEAVRLGLVDDDGWRLFTLDEASTYLAAYESQALVTAPGARAQELRVAFSMHAMNATFATEIQQFFLEWL